MALVATPILKFVDLCLRLMKCRDEILTILTAPTSASRPPQPGKADPGTPSVPRTPASRGLFWHKSNVSLTRQLRGMVTGLQY